MKLNDLKHTQLAVIGGLAMLAVCATTAKADGAPAGWYLSSDAGINTMESFRHVSTEPGGRWGLEGGYALSLSPQLTLGTELETGILYNNLRSGKAHGEATQIPLLANLVLNCHVGKWVPYLGVGGGVENTSISVGGGGYHGTDLAFQAQAGLRYQLSDNLDVGLGYKYLADFTSRNVTISNNALLLSATYHF
jgi:opacity protein-like surface antigen